MHCKAGDWASSAEGQKKGLKQVEAKACIALMHNPEKAAQAETVVHLLHALLKGSLKSNACGQISHSFGLEVCLPQQLLLCLVFI